MEYICETLRIYRYYECMLISFIDNLVQCKQRFHLACRSEFPLSYTELKRQKYNTRMHTFTMKGTTSMCTEINSKIVCIEHFQLKLVKRCVQ